MARCLNVDRSTVLASASRPLNKLEEEKFIAFCERRRSREPVAYIIGEKEFSSLSLQIDERALIPRPETEVLVEEALSFAAGRNGTLSVLEIGTGSGAVSIALASELSEARFTATDLSEGALEVAQENARRLGIINRIEFIQGDLFDPVRGKSTS